MKMHQGFTCDYCWTSFESEYLIVQHIRQHLSMCDEKGTGTELGWTKDHNYNNTESVLILSNRKSQVNVSGGSVIGGPSRVYRCKICQKHLTDCFQSETHVENESVHMKNQCQNCLFYFDSTNSLENHMLEKRCSELKLGDHDSVVEFYECSVCGLQFENDEHKQEHDVKAQCWMKMSNFYKCGKCDMLFSDFEEWSVHEEGHLKWSPFGCVICAVEYCDVKNLKRHIEVQHKNPSSVSKDSSLIYKCDLCEESFDRAYTLLKHREIHLDMRPFKCFSCTKTYKTISKLRRHKRTSHYKSTPKTKTEIPSKQADLALQLTCKVCDIRFQKHVDLKIHQAEHCDGNCFFCNAKMNSITRLKHHIAGHYGLAQCKFCARVLEQSLLSSHAPCKASPFLCELCTRYFPDVSTLTNHRNVCQVPARPLKTLNREEWYFLCEFCGKLKKNMNRLKYHIIKCHSPRARSFQCKRCKSNHDNRHSLQQHRYEAHSEMKNSKCSKCLRLFASKGSLAAHMKRVHVEKKDAKIPCSKCDKKFASKNLLRIHYNVHMADSKPYKCELCDVRFSQRCNLNKHRIIHTGAKPYKCDKCPRAYNHRSSLLKHKYVHTGIFPYNCSVCSSGFPSRRLLRQHKKRHVGLSFYTK